jgi:MoaA/NifB/PqqE/SkfB family radical SAM enzyme
MHLTGLHLLLSYQCTYQCDHCFVHSSPEAPGTMTLALIRNAIEQAAGLGTITEIYLEGGEPFLFYPLMLEAARLARKKNLDVGIVTNGYYATTVEDAKLWLKPLKELGVEYISFSDDTFHSGDEKESFAARARQAAEELGMDCGTICIEPPLKLEDDHHPGEPITGGGTVSWAGGREACG